MAIETPKQHPRGRKTLHEALRLRVAARDPWLQGSPRTLAGLPVYTLAWSDVSRGAFAAKARRTGWVYPVVGGKSPALALLAMDEAGRPAYAGAIASSLARRLLRAGARAEAELGAARTRFHPRILEIPSLRLFALWLHAPRDASRFVAITHERASEARVLTAKEMRERIDRAPARRRD